MGKVAGLALGAGLVAGVAVEVGRWGGNLGACISRVYIFYLNHIPWCWSQQALDRRMNCPMTGEKSDQVPYKKGACQIPCLIIL